VKPGISRIKSSPVGPHHVVLAFLAVFAGAWLIRENITITYPPHRTIQVPIVAFTPPHLGPKAWVSGEATVEFLYEGRMDRRKVAIWRDDLIAGKRADSLTGPNDVPPGTLIEVFQNTGDPWQLSARLQDLEPRTRSARIHTITGWVMVISGFFGGAFVFFWVQAEIWGSP
jgi:hypothetical protein